MRDRADITFGSMESTKPQILVVEDDESIAEAVAFHLERAGMNPAWRVTASPGCARCAPTSRTCWCWTSCSPAVDGWHIIREVRDWAPRLPVIG